MSRYGNHNAKNLELLAESQRIYPNGVNPYHEEFVQKYCCVVCKREIPPMQGWYQRQRIGEKIHIACYQPQP
jgi:hypothetical protein